MSKELESLKTPRDCPRCEGTGKLRYDWGDEQNRRERACSTCNGKCLFYCPDFEAILKQILGRKGLRTSRPDRELGGRPYYVWRLARFHGGADVTMPVMADLELGRDPFKKELDIFAEEVAKKVYGTDMAGANRWAKALDYR